MVDIDLKNKIIVTIDTEMDATIQWEKPYPPKFTSVTYGIPQMLRPIWDKYKIHPIYFVSNEVLQDADACRVLKNEVKKGAIIGTHLHPEYVLDTEHIKSGKGSKQFPCYACSTEEEKRKIIALTQEIERKIGVKPIWYRAARFGADIDTIKILSELGYQYDSSVTPNINWRKKGGPDHSGGLHEPYYISMQNYYKASTVQENIIEVPVTIEEKRWGFIGNLLPENWLFYKWLRPTHMFLYEEKALVRKYKKEKKALVMMFHSMEVMINKSPYVRNKLMQQYYLYRLDRTIKYALKNGYESI